jgi:hypothetical protein
MASTNVACAKFVGVGESSAVVEGMDSSLLSLENHGRPSPAPAVLGDLTVLNMFLTLSLVMISFATWV